MAKIFKVYEVEERKAKLEELHRALYAFFGLVQKGH